MTNYNDGNWHFWPGHVKNNEFGYRWSSIDELEALLNIHPQSRLEFYTLGVAKSSLTHTFEIAAAYDWFKPCLFRVIKVHNEPKTIWVNEYTRAGGGTSFSSEIAARQDASMDCLRVAVKYVEQVSQ